MLRNITIFDVEEIQKICNYELGYDVDLSIVKKQIEKLTNDRKHHIIIGYENDRVRKIVGFVHAEFYESLYMHTGLNILALAVDSKFQGQFFSTSPTILLRLGTSVNSSFKIACLISSIYCFIADFIATSV